MKRFFGFLLMLLTVVAVSAKDIKTVILTTNPELECGKCENKVKENLRFVKGVKDIHMPRGHVNGDLRGAFKAVVNPETKEILGVTLFWSRIS